jgi:3-oxoacyl-[acyl-carrier-protein] synthase II
LSTPRVVVSGIGSVNPLGLNIEEFWEGLVAGKSGIGPITHFDASKFYVKVAAEVKNFNPAEYMDPKSVDRNPRAVHFGLAAARQAIKNAKLDMAQEIPERVGACVGCMVESDYIVRQNEILEKRGPRRVEPLFVAKSSPSAVSMQIGMFLGAKGPNTSVNSLCATGADSIGTAANFIRLGYADVMIAGGADSALSPVGMAGLDILGALSREPDPAKACRPFDLNRSGFIFGEGSGIVILESEKHARKRGAPIWAEIAGTGWSFDAYDQTAPAPEAEAYAMKMAMEYAGVQPKDIDYINAHGTSTKLNDCNETKAIKMAFGDWAYKIPISSTKSMIGHIVTAAGAIEAIVCMLIMDKGIIHPTINYETPDPECDLDYVPNVARQAKVNTCLTNSFGLGGENCCLVIKRFKK